MAQAYAQLPGGLFQIAFNRRYNFDGIISIHNNKVVYSYLQFFRNGIIEAVDSSLFHWIQDNSLDFDVLENYLLNKLIPKLVDYIKFYEKISVEPPFVVALSLLGIKDITIDGNKFDRDNLILPEILVENYDENPDLFMKPIFDQIRNAAGLPGSPDYDNDGKHRSDKNI